MREAANPRRRWRIGRLMAFGVGGVAGLLVLAFLALFVRLVTYADPWMAQVAAAGYVQKTATVNGVQLSYVEGPDNGPPLVLLHAQLLDWSSYRRVLPALSQHFHVFDVDYPGHGATVTPADYPMNANRIGADLADFIAGTIGQPVFLTGNSSGGLLTVWLTANRPDLVRAALLEDPPLFSAEYPRIKQTVADRAFRTSFTAAGQDHPPDFLLYWLHANAPFFTRYVAPGSADLLALAVRARRWTHPGDALEIGILPNPTVQALMRGLDEYDPRFGAAFYDGTWNQGFDHADALRRITRDTLLLQANFGTLPDGTLDGAMSREEAERATALLPGGRYVKVDASHVVNLDQPELFTRLLLDFFLGSQTGQ